MIVEMQYLAETPTVLIEIMQVEWEIKLDKRKSYWIVVKENCFEKKTEKMTGIRD